MSTTVVANSSVLYRAAIMLIRVVLGVERTTRRKLR